MPSDCIFCKIIDGEIPCVKIFEDEEVLAFLDVGPVSEGHTLIIPKHHCSRLDQCDAQIIATLAAHFGKVAKAVVKAVNADGYNVICNTGKAAGQAVDHVHFHIIPRHTGDGVLNRWPSGEYHKSRMNEVAELIRDNL